MRIVHYYPGALGSSGVTVALWEWASALADAGVEVCVLHGGRDEQPPSAAFGEFHDRQASVELRAVPHSGARRVFRRPIDLETHLRGGDLLVLHEGWVTANVAAARAAGRAGVPYMVMPHGVYKPDWRRYLKPPRLLREALERRVLEGALAVHVFFPSEGKDVHALAPAARLLVVPTGFSRRVPEWRGGGGYLAWVGRYDPQHKGLDLVVDAMAMLPPPARRPVILHGYDYRGGKDRLRDQIGRLQLDACIDVRGLVQGAAKVEFLRQADGNLHPARWESHSMALLESLAIGVPTLASSSMDIAGVLRDARAAVVVDPRPGAIAAGILELADSALVLSRNSRQLVATRFSWPELVPRYLAELARLGID